MRVQPPEGVPGAQGPPDVLDRNLEDGPRNPGRAMVDRRLGGGHREARLGGHARLTDEVFTRATDPHVSLELVQEPSVDRLLEQLHSGRLVLGGGSEPPLCPKGVRYAQIRGPLELDEHIAVDRELQSDAAGDLQQHT